MNCPDCNAPMEGEDVPMLIDLKPAPGYKVMGDPLEGRFCPHKHYRCDECDCEWVWTKGVSGIRKLDGADRHVSIETLREV